MKRKIGGMIAAAAIVMFGSFAPANAVVGVSGPAATDAGYATPVIVINQGGSLTYVNGDPLAPHNIQADGKYVAGDKASWCGKGAGKANNEPGKCPLFWSATIGVGQTPVLGVDKLAGGGATYPFLCVVHPKMKGTLVVV